MTDTAHPPSAPGRPRPDAAVDRAQYRRGTRYGIAAVAVPLGVYQLLSWDVTPLIHALDPMWVLQSILQLLVGLTLLVGGLAVAPTSPVRAVLASVLALGAVGAAAGLMALRLTSGLLAGPPALWSVLSPGYAALASALLGWLIVRRRHPLTYVLVIGALIPGLVRYQLLLAGVDMTLVRLMDVVLTAGVGVIGAWIAFAVTALLGAGTSDRFRVR